VVDSGQWVSIARSDLPQWNERLLKSAAHVHQYPFWNEPLKHLHLGRQYVVHRSGGREDAYVCLLWIGLPCLRIGIARGGPVSLREDGNVPPETVKQLRQWASRRGYIAVRFSHTDEKIIETVAASGGGDGSDPLPLYDYPEHEMLVELSGDEQAMLAGFQTIARRDIRKASAAGYEIQVTDDPAVLERTKRIYAAMFSRKGRQVYRRPLASYAELIRLARRHQSVRVYTVLHGGTPVQSILILRDRDTAHYVIGALDVEALKDAPTPSCLLHWTAMREFQAMGVKRYSLGRGAGAVRTFKEKFHPTVAEYPRAHTAILRPRMYRLWMKSNPWLMRAAGYAARKVLH